MNQCHVNFDKQQPTCKINAKLTCLYLLYFSTLHCRICIFELFFFCICCQQSVANTRLLQGKMSSYMFNFQSVCFRRNECKNWQFGCKFRNSSQLAIKIWKPHAWQFVILAPLRYRHEHGVNIKGLLGLITYCWHQRGIRTYWIIFLDLHITHGFFCDI
jgi:hypothetical protein